MLVSSSARTGVGQPRRVYRGDRGAVADGDVSERQVAGEDQILDEQSPASPKEPNKQVEPKRKQIEHGGDL